VTDLDAIAAELAEARRFQTTILVACAAHIEALAEHDEWARTLSFLLRDAEARCATARFEAMFALPSAPLLDRSSRAGEDRGS
jgi:hypothetical protein